MRAGHSGKRSILQIVVHEPSCEMSWNEEMRVVDVTVGYIVDKLLVFLKVRNERACPSSSAVFGS